MKARCAWVPQGVPEYVAYHDEEWGVPLRDDRALFELITLEGAQAGLSWLTLLRKRDGYRRAFDDFDVETAASCMLDRCRLAPSTTEKRSRQHSINTQWRSKPGRFWPI